MRAVQSRGFDPDRKVCSVSSRRSDAGVPNLNGWNDDSPRHSGTAFRVHHKLRNAIVCVVVALLTFVGTAAAATYVNIGGIIDGQSVDFIGANGKAVATSIVDPNAGKPLDILILGQDTRSGEDNLSIGGSDKTLESNHNSDTAMVMHISADRKFIDLMSIPRDSIVDVPACTTTKGVVKAQYDVMFNSIFANAYSKGDDLASAASCTVNAVNSLTGLDIQNFIVVDFAGLKSMIDAIGGVDVCLPSHVFDGYTGINLDAGWQHLDGLTATQYARRRHGADTDGTDMERTARQQYLIKQLIAQALSKNMLTQSSQLYQLAKAALKSLNISSGLANTTTLAGLAMSMKDFDTSHLYTRTVPVTDWPTNRNHVMWTAEADTYWAKMRNDKPLFDESGSSSSDSSSASSDSSSSDSSDSSDSSTDQSNQSDQSTTDQQGSDATQSDQSGSSSEQTQTKPNTKVADGVEKTADGQYIDTATGGVIDEKTGIIHNATTNVVMGISESYLNNVVCKVK
nr:LCP family protein [Bifidobacterium santillanense]